MITNCCWLVSDRTVQLRRSTTVASNLTIYLYNAFSHNRICTPLPQEAQTMLSKIISNKVIGYAIGVATFLIVNEVG